jgi:hypothetical protein
MVMLGKGIRVVVGPPVPTSVGAIHEAAGLSVASVEFNGGVDVGGEVVPCKNVDVAPGITVEVLVPIPG